MWPEGVFSPQRTPAEADSRQELQLVERSPLWSNMSDRSCWTHAVCSWRMDPMIRTHVGAVLERLLPVGSPCRICPWRTASYGREATLEQGKLVKRKKEWQWWSITDWPQPPFPLCFSGEKVGGRCFQVAFRSCCSSLLSVGSKLH